MKFLYFTDPHLTAKAPSSRKDIYYKTSFEKMKEVGEIASAENVDLIFCGGDLFHSPVVSLNYAGKIAKIIQSWKKPFIVVPGNHDLFGYSISTINQTMLGMFSKTNTLRLLTRDTPLRIKIGSRMVAIEGREYSGLLDTDPSNYQPDIIDVDFNILINHGMLLDKEYIPGIHYTMTKDIEFPADITLGGHYHYGFNEHECNGGKFFNPGSLFRTEASKANKTFQPKVLIFDVVDTPSGIEYSYKYIALQSAKPSDEVFDFSSIQNKKNSTALLDQFKQFVINTSSVTASSSVEDMIRDVAKDNSLSQDIIDEALQRIQKAHTKDVDSLQANGYVEQKAKVFIEKIVLENFQSHENTAIEFEEGFNVIVGETNSGKTSILRALQWVLYNTPKGSDFIRTGADECSVTLYLSNGFRIIRKRTRDNAGEYIVVDGSGASQVYKGFGNSMPIEVYNAHQMPPVMLTKDTMVSLNMATQLEGPFLISMNPSDKANAIGRIIGSQVLDDAIKEASKDVSNLNREVTSMKKQITQKENEKTFYDFLPDYYTKLRQSEIALDKAAKNKEETAQMKNHKASYENAVQQIDGCQLALEKFDFLPELEKNIPKIELAFSKVQEMEEQFSQLTIVDLTIDALKDKIASAPELDKISSSLKELEQVTKELKEAKQLQEAYSSAYQEQLSISSKLLTTPQINKEELSLLETLMKQMTEAKKLSKEFEDAALLAYEAESARSKSSVKETLILDNIERAEIGLRELLEKNKICPLCETPLSEHSIDHILGKE